ncbi:PP2C family protein-serine/threonine phosphatase [Pseudobacteriovorax antillogorgiicola]|uniref:7TM diverse intracellular signalling n=1 Tax=Pseudobacteriovorax antillogorgiicola TaxID=1513793 RepID=A0A1Y6B7V0_9BACT|nr:SpoIIE family protein phosphatase [Pseudobacteriovorax antillogorgiicola]TCS58790.1 7TM protein involved in diverse intracellular signaling [Pseudobacteriovorax antillogorgiicola]SME94692.1 7TM diverse intracellular signalling [Pseudobacteriovorax antillogorgiicola]
MILLSFTFSIFFLISDTVIADSKEADSIYKVSDGILDLRSWDPSQGEVKLSGTWKFIPSQLIRDPKSHSWEDLWNQADIAATGVFWNNHGNPEVNNARYGTYLLKVLWPRDWSQPLAWGEAMGINSAFEVIDWQSGRLLARSGFPAENLADEIPWWMERVFPISGALDLPDESWFLIPVSCFSYHGGGIMIPPVIDLYENLFQQLTYKRFIIHINVGFLLVLAFYHTILYFYLRSERANLYFAMICASMCMRQYTTERIIEDFIGVWGTHWYSLLNFRIEYATTTVGVFCLQRYLECLMPGIMGRTKAIKFWQILALGLFLSTIFIPNYDMLSRILPLFQIFYIISIASFFALLLNRSRSMNKDRITARIFSVLLFFLWASVFFDIVVLQFSIKSPMLAHYSIAIFFVGQSIILARNYQRAFRHERNLEEAKQVQKAFMPGEQSIPDLAVASYYQSAEQTGGDWFDYHYDPGTGNIYALVGDVTGHGIASALITGTAIGAARSSIHFIREHQMGVEEGSIHMVRTINEAIIPTGHKVRKLMTMALVSWNMNTGDGCYINLGHQPLIKVSRRLGPKIVLKGGPILGLDQNISIEAQPFTLESGDYVVLFSDGLLENPGMQGQVLKMRKIIKSLRQADNPRQAIDRIQSMTKEIWQDRDIEDDCTVLALGRSA